METEWMKNQQEDRQERIKRFLKEAPSVVSDILIEMKSLDIYKIINGKYIILFKKIEEYITENKIDFDEDILEEIRREIYS